MFRLKDVLVRLCGGCILKFFTMRTGNLVFTLSVVAWRGFVLDNGISVGDVLVFELVEFSRFLVHLYPPDASVVPYRFSSHLCGKTRGFCRSGKEEPALLNSDEDMSPSPLSSTSDKMACVPRFMKILRPAHLKRLLQFCHWLQQDVPTQFWRSHGWKMFDRKVFSLEGPQKDGQVRAYVVRLSIQTKCCFGGQEWKSFFIRRLCRFGCFNCYQARGL